MDFLNLKSLLPAFLHSFIHSSFITAILATFHSSSAYHIANIPHFTSRWVCWKGQRLKTKNSAWVACALCNWLCKHSKESSQSCAQVRYTKNSQVKKKNRKTKKPKIEKEKAKAERVRTVSQSAAAAAEWGAEGASHDALAFNLSW